MQDIRIAQQKDIQFLKENDRHIASDILKESIECKRIYILEVEGKIVGWLRYNLFWDNTPFMNMLYILEEYRKKGYGKALVNHWESQMKARGYSEVLTSTLVHEEAILFYLKLNYQIVGGLHPDANEHEAILRKRLV